MLERDRFEDGERTGEPGSGKTHTINRYVQWLRERGVEPAVTASTGIAATHVNGMTIHSWSGIGVKSTSPTMTSSSSRAGRKPRDASSMRKCSSSTRYRCSMRRPSRASTGCCARCAANAHARRAVRRIAGDIRRRFLPAAADFQKRSRRQFAFESPAWKEANPVICYLNEQHRQDDGDFLDLLGALRQGKLRGASHASLRRASASVEADRRHAPLHAQRRRRPHESRFAREDPRQRARVPDDLARPCEARRVAQRSSAFRRRRWNSKRAQK